MITVQIYKIGMDCLVQFVDSIWFGWVVHEKPFKYSELIIYQTIWLRMELVWKSYEY